MARAKDEQKTELIFQATLKLVLASGFSGLKMSEVAKEAGLATGTVYIYFQDKNQLINQLYLHLKKKHVSGYLANFNESAPFMVSFRQIWFNFASVAMNSIEEAVFLDQYYRSPYITEDNKKISRNLLDPIYSLIRKGKTEALVKDVEEEILVAQLVGPIHEMVRLHAEKTLHADTKVQETFFKMGWDSIKQ